MSHGYRHPSMIARDIRIARRRGQNVDVEDFLRGQRRAERYPNLRVREHELSGGVLTTGTRHIEAAPTLEDYDKGITRRHR